MRRQYHSRRINAQMMIWDVHRLIDLSKQLAVKEVSLADISELDESFWFESRPATCREVAQHAHLIAETDLQFPIILSSEGRVMDGMHRVCKALLAQKGKILAVQFEVNPTPDYVDVDLTSLPYNDPW